MRRTTMKQMVLGLAGCGLAIVWSVSVATAGRPILEGLDPNKPLILPIQVKAAYNDSQMFFNLKWEGNKGDTHDLVRFNGAGWQKEGGPRREAESTDQGTPGWGPTDLTSTNYESRATWMVNDPSGDHAVAGFGDIGCFATCHDNSRAMPEWDASTGGANKKYLREDMNPTLPGKSEPRLDLWHHRMARANPIGVSDDQYIKVTDGSGGRKGDGGEGGPYQSNTIITDEHGSHPQWVLDPTTTVDGKYAFSFDDVHTDPDRDFMDPAGSPPIGVAKSMDYHVAITAGAPGFAPYEPSEDDTVPNRRLRSKIGTPRGDITADGTSFTPIANPNYDPGHYGLFESSTQRLLDTGADDVGGDHSDTIMAEGDVYDIAFAVHTGMVTVRDHYVGFPLKLSLDPATAGDLNAVKLTGEETPDWSQIDPLDIDLFLPGIASLEFLQNENFGTKEYIDPATGLTVDQFHGGGAGGTVGACKNCHTSSGASNPMSMESLVPQRGGVWTQTPRPVPEPTTLALLTLLGVLGLAVVGRKRG